MPDKKSSKINVARDSNTSTYGSTPKAKDGSTNVNKKVWEQAELAASSQSGGFSGVSKEAQKQAIQEKYDQLISSDRQQRKAFGAILGDI